MSIITKHFVDIARSINNSLINNSTSLNVDTMKTIIKEASHTNVENGDSSLPDNPPSPDAPKICFNTVKNETDKELNAKYIDIFDINQLKHALSELQDYKNTLKKKEDMTNELIRHSPKTLSIDWSNIKMTDDWEPCIAKNVDPILSSSLLGRGTYGVVSRLRHKLTGQIYAVKSIDKHAVIDSSMEAQVENEIRFQTMSSHHNILQCYGCVEDIYFVHLFMECCDKGDLYQRMKSRPTRRFSENEAFIYFMQLVNGLAYIHHHGYFHRDLKLENLLVGSDSDETLRIADFGWIGQILGSCINRNFCGTLDYLCPEMIQGSGHDWRSDIWGAGILLYEMLVGTPPFHSLDPETLIQNIVLNKIEFPKIIPIDAQDVIKQLLHPDPYKRIRLDDLVGLDWIKKKWLHYVSDLLDSSKLFDLHLCTPKSNDYIQCEVINDDTRFVPEDNSNVRVSSVSPKETHFTQQSNVPIFENDLTVDPITENKNMMIPPYEEIDTIPSLNPQCLLPETIMSTNPLLFDLTTDTNDSHDKNYFSNVSTTIEKGIEGPSMISEDNHIYSNNSTVQMAINDSTPTQTECVIQPLCLPMNSTSSHRIDQLSTHNVQPIMSIGTPKISPQSNHTILPRQQTWSNNNIIKQQEQDHLMINQEYNLSNDYISQNLSSQQLENSIPIPRRHYTTFVPNNIIRTTFKGSKPPARHFTSYLKNGILHPQWVEPQQFLCNQHTASYLFEKNQSSLNVYPQLNQTMYKFPILTNTCVSTNHQLRPIHIHHSDTLIQTQPTKSPAIQRFCSPMIMHSCKRPSPIVENQSPLVKPVNFYNEQHHTIPIQVLRHNPRCKWRQPLRKRISTNDVSHPQQDKKIPSTLWEGLFDYIKHAKLKNVLTF